ncbi:interleukin-22 receptor subunit alpha-2 [Genypterus blacodes]|uniref:interleukin-22 receptor subunit alpha-2 n=1 Tax=Genypterus blacodes TaxID=154954 RepID=UPI003F766EB2
MTCLLLQAALLGSLCACLTTQVVLPRPAHVRFESVDYRNVVLWTPASNGTALLYYVQWKIYGEPEWQDVVKCQGIQESRCDLSGLTSEPREWYYAKVHASSLPSSKSAWTLSPRFSPRWDTTLSTPGLKLNVTRHGIVVRVKRSHQLPQKMHNKLLFNIYLIHTSGEEEVHEIGWSTKKLLLDKVRRRAQYCLQVQTVIPLQAKSSDRSSIQCVKTL